LFAAASCHHHFANMAEMGIITDVLPEVSMREPDIKTQLVLCSLAALEGADNQLLGSSLFINMGYNQGGLGLDGFKLAAMSAIQGITTNLFAPFWGMTADRGLLSQRVLMTIAAVGQGIATIWLALLTEYGTTMWMIRGLNGIFLAGLRPIANGVVAKRTSTHLQGKVFSRVLVFIQVGTAFCSLVVTPMSGIKFGYWGDILVLGWRPAWIFVGLMSLIVAAATMIFMTEGELPKNTSKKNMCAALAEEIGLFVSFLKIPTFGIMVLQGIFGTIPWTVLWMGITYYQIGGMSGLDAGYLQALTPFCAMFGTMIGGALSDKLQGTFGANGRPLTAQLTVALGIPFMYMNFYGFPPGSSWYTYLAMNAGFGIFGQWAQAGCNWPILAQIVPEAYRSRVMAIEGAAENSLAAFLGPYFLAYIADWLGFNAGSVQAGETDLVQARKMGLSLCLTTCVPWLLAFLVYSFLHVTAPIDLQAARDAAMKEEQDQSVGRGQSVGRRASRDSSAGYVMSRTFSAAGTHA